MGFGKLTSLLKIDFSARDKNINRQIIFSFLAKGLGLSISLVQIPLLLDILGTESYGIWLTLLSITSWISIMDIGIGNGLRNKLTESLATNDLEKARKYVSTAYVSLALIMLLPFLLAVLILPFVNIQTLLNTTIDSRTLLLTMLITVSSTVLSFVLSLVNQILFALQKNALIAIPSLFLSAALIAILYLLPHYTTIGLTQIATIYAILNIASLVMFTVYVFNRWPYLRPTIKAYEKSYVNDILSLGFRFFLIQIAGIIIFSTDNFIITKLFGPELVTSFNVTFRLFNFISMALAIIMTPFWSAYTEAYAKKEYNWIKNRIRVMNLSMLPLAIILAMLTYYHDALVNLWVGNKIATPQALPIFMAFYVLVSAWNNIFAFFLNGISRTREQLITSIIAMIMNIPLSIFLAKNLGFGVNGIILASLVCLFIFAIVGPITTYKTLNDHATH
jgi:O-antigen/teichoic acid export membrane protein